MKKLVPVFILFLSISLSLFSQTKRPMSFDDLINIGRVADPRISPNGDLIAFVVTYHDKAQNKTNSNIYLIPTNGGEVRQLTSAKGANNSPRWMPDGKSIAFVSSRDGESQIWIISVEGGEARRVSTISTEASGLIVSPDGKWFAFSSDVYPDCQSDDCNKERMEAVEKNKVKAKIFQSLPYRVWNSWKDGKRSHLFVMPLVGGVARDLTPGDYDAPPIDLGGNWDYAFSPDSKEIAFERNTDPVVAVRTNNDIYVVPVVGGTPRKISENPANDSQPLYSPDGNYIVYSAMKRPGFEADQNQIVLYDRNSGKVESLTSAFDYSFREVVWSPDSKTLYCNADDKGNVSLFRISILDKRLTVLQDKGINGSLQLSPDGKTLAFLRDNVNKPTEVFRMDVDGANLKQLTFINAQRISQLDMNPLEDFWFEGAGGTKWKDFSSNPRHLTVQRNIL